MKKSGSKGCRVQEPVQLTVLGCWSPYPRAGGACSGYLVRIENTYILLECGNGVFARLASLADFRLLNAVVISHLHPDHYADIFCLRHAVEYARRTGVMKERLKLFLPGEPAEKFNELSGLSDAFDAINICELPESELPENELSKNELPACDLPGLFLKKTRVGPLEVEFFPVRHKLRTYAAAFKTNGRKRLVFSADTGYFEQLAAFAVGADFLLCEASGRDGDLEYLGEFHLTARKAGQLAARARVRQLAITHFFPEYDTRQLLIQARKGYEEEYREVQGQETGKLPGTGVGYEKDYKQRVISVQEGETYFITAAYKSERG